MGGVKKSVNGYLNNIPSDWIGNSGSFSKFI